MKKIFYTSFLLLIITLLVVISIVLYLKHEQISWCAYFVLLAYCFASLINQLLDNIVEKMEKDKKYE